MAKTLNIFLKMPCLTERSKPLSGSAIQKKWFKAADKRIMGQYLQKFVTYNKDCFDFIGVLPYIYGTEQNIEIGFQSSQFIGSIPLRGADTGKQIGDFIVTPRFIRKNLFEEYTEIINLLGEDIQIEFLDSLTLTSGQNFRPPLYLEAVKFIKQLENLVKVPWRKFGNEEVIKNAPLGQVNWNKYIQNEYKAENKLKFPVKKNILTEYHKEYAQIKYVFDLCKENIMASTTPIKVRLALRSKIEFISSKLYRHDAIKTDAIKIHNSDSVLITQCKMLANNILNYQFTDSLGWRVDFNQVFEKFVQYIFKEYAKEAGAQLYTNFQFKVSKSNTTSWQLKQLEPDAILQKENIDIFIDAKYKSHLFNKYDQSEKLKDEHRKDLHQILAYNSFNKSPTKHGFLCYPSKEIEFKELTYTNPLNGTENKIMILGIPLNISSVNETKKVLQKHLSTLLNAVP